MKQCRQCQQIKKEECFYKKKQGFLSPNCKTCLSEYHRNRYAQKVSIMQEPILSREEARILYEQIYA